MASDGTPEFAAKQCGAKIGQLRESRGWKRPKLVARLLDTLDIDDPNYDSICEAWLARLETGRMVKVPRQTLEALCRALNCTERERADVMLYADRSVLNQPDEHPNRIAEVLNYGIARLHREAESILKTLISQRHTADLSDDELYELFIAAVNIILHDGH